VSTFPVQRRGDRNAAVRVILSRLLLPAVDVDGGFGPKTKTAVKDFQAANGLAQDGIVGPQTWRALANAASLDSED
jgi:peptidoglycan hydrolase-like protein with peptidoglycan-binding domain